MGKLRAVFTILQMIITVSITIILMYLFKKNNKKIRQLWASIQMKLMGIKIELIGSIDEDANMMIMNHQSVMDIIIFEYLSAKNTAWIAKKEIADIPWFGRILKAPDMIIVQRESKSALIKLIKDSKQKLNDDRPLAIFPEGTRTDGKKLRKFKAGAKIIANKFNLKVQPFIIINSLEILDSKKLIQKSGTIKVICLPTIQASKDSTWYEDTELLMKDTLQKGLEDGK
jgi:1-acyl-sn-glycerol-3-phosphate acyltransferase